MAADGSDFPVDKTRAFGKLILFGEVSLLWLLLYVAWGRLILISDHFILSSHVPSIPSYHYLYLFHQQTSSTS